MLHGVGLEGGHVGGLGLLGGGVHRLLHGPAGEGGAGYHVHTSAVGGDDVGKHDIEGGGTHVVGLLGGVDLNISDGGVAEGHVQGQLGVIAGGGAGVGSGGKAEGAVVGAALALGGGQGGSGGLLHGVRGEGGAGDAVDLGALGVLHLLGQLLQSGAAHAGGLPLPGDGHVGDGVGIHGEGHGHRSAVALGAALVGAGSVDPGGVGLLALAGRHGQGHDQRQGKGCDSLLHLKSSFYPCWNMSDHGRPEVRPPSTHFAEPCSPRVS